MKNIFLNKVIKIVPALLYIMLLHKVEAVNGQEAHKALATLQKFENIDEWVKAFEDPERDEWQKPDEVVKSLNLKPGDVVADIGAGTGYFTRRFAKAVSPGGLALGLEIKPSMVQSMTKDAQKLELYNYKALLIKPDNPELEPGSVDLVFLCNAYHHIENRVDYLIKLSKCLKKYGRVVIVDFYNKPLPVGPQAADHKLSKKAVLEEFLAAGYKLKHDKDFLPYQYYLEFGL